MCIFYFLEPVCLQLELLIILHHFPLHRVTIRNLLNLVDWGLMLLEVYLGHLKEVVDRQH